MGWAACGVFLACRARCALLRHLTTCPLSIPSPFRSLGAWEAAEFADPSTYVTTLTPTQVQELDAMAARIPPGTPIRTVALTRNLRALAPRLGALLEATAAEVRSGRGFALLRGLPVPSTRPGMTAWDVTLRYWLVGAYFGAARPNTQTGHLVGHIFDLKLDPHHPDTRLYATCAAQPWHNDSADLVSLLCLEQAAEGGGSAWASSAAIRDALVAEDPAAAAVLAERGIWFYDRKGEVPDGKAGYFEMPVFNYHGGRLFVNLSSNYYYAAASRFDAVPPLTPEQKAAVAKVESMAASERFALRAQLAPGDVQVLNNHTTLHTREAFKDGPGATRHLLRLWLSSADDPPLPPVYRELYGDDELIPGKRGGIRVDGVKLREEDLYVPLSPDG